MACLSDSIQCNENSSEKGRSSCWEFHGVAQNEANVSGLLVEVESGSPILRQELFFGPDVATGGGAVGRLLWGFKWDWSRCNDLGIWRLLCWVSNAGGAIWSSPLSEGAWLADTILGDVLNLWPASWFAAASSVGADWLVEWAVLASTILQHSLSDVASIGSTGQSVSLGSLVVWAVDTGSIFAKLLSVLASMSHTTRSICWSSGVCIAISASSIN